MEEEGTQDNRFDVAVMKAVRRGAGLSSSMIPDPAMPSNAPEHIESYQEPHMVLHEGYGWGITRASHLIYRKKIASNAKRYGRSQKESIAPPLSFIYLLGSSVRFFASYSIAWQLAQWMMCERYKRFNWQLDENWLVVWDSAWRKEGGGSTGTEKLWHALDQGWELSVAFIDSEGIKWTPLSRHRF